MDLLRRLERHLRRHGISATALGREAAGDPNLVRELRRGRVLGAVLRARIDAYLEAARPRKPARRQRRRP